MTCPCGQTHTEAEAAVAALVAALGERVRVTVPEGTWLVPRVFIAAHGLKASELAGLADRFGWCQDVGTRERG